MFWFAVIAFIVIVNIGGALFATDQEPVYDTGRSCIPGVGCTDTNKEDAMRDQYLRDLRDEWEAEQ